MRRFVRLPEPDKLTVYKDQITSHYIRKRDENKPYLFNWPQRDGQTIREFILPLLIKQTQDHCSYCDGFPLKRDDYTIDHFKPKSIPEYYHLVAEWTNLYLCCGACQERKNRYNVLLLRPDDVHYSFEEYFDYNFEKHKLTPNTAKPVENQERARVTIDMFDLNHIGQKRSGQLMLKAFKEDETKNMDDFGYRFMFDITK
jgi:uncharacterized protein (TIGR02646 family)